MVTEYSELTPKDVEVLKGIFREHLPVLKRYETKIRQASATALRRKLQKQGLSLQRRQVIEIPPVQLKDVDNRTFTRDLCYAMREAMKHTVEVIGRKTSTTKAERIGMWANSLRRQLQESPVIYSRVLEPGKKRARYDIYGSIKWLTDPKNWTDVGVLKISSYSYRSSEGDKFVKSEAGYWAQDARDRIYKEPKDDIEEDLRDCKRMMSSSEALIKDAEKLNKKADDVVDGLVKVAEELAA